MFFKKCILWNTSITSIRDQSTLIDSSALLAKKKKSAVLLAFESWKGNENIEYLFNKSLGNIEYKKNTAIVGLWGVKLLHLWANGQIWNICIAVVDEPISSFFLCCTFNSILPLHKFLHFFQIIWVKRLFYLPVLSSWLC